MTRYNPAEEKNVLRLLSEGSEFAFTLLFDHYRGRVYSVALRFLKSRELAEEVVQEVFLKLWAKRSGLTGIDNFEAYLFTIARNLIFDLVRELAKESATKKDLIPAIESAVGADEALLDEQYQRLLLEAVDHLPPQQKQIFRLARIEGLSHQAIADELQISRLTVKTHMAKALHSIRQNLQHHLITLATLLSFCAL